MENKIIFRSVIEVLGSPKEHIEEAIKGYIKKLKENEDYIVLSEEFAEIKKQEDQNLWATFAEIEVETADFNNIVNFCFDYMPSLIEIISPTTISYNNAEFSAILNDLMAKLHSVDMVAKQFRLENDHLKKDSANLLKNYLTILLKENNFSSEMLSTLTGVVKDKLEDFLDQLIDEGKIDLKEGIYYLK